MTLDNLNVCITGTLRRMTRAKAFNLILAENGNPQKKISKSTDLLVVTNEAKTYPTYKTMKAELWNIETISESDFYELVGVNWI